jgi:hypothetical protein
LIEGPVWADSDRCCATHISTQRAGTVAEYGPNFAAIAERMLEVVTCIDITDNQNSERPTDLLQLLESNPNLTDCKIDLMGQRHSVKRIPKADL